MTLRSRLLLAALYLLTVVVVALEVPLAVNVGRRAERETEGSILTQATLLAARINDDVPKAGTDPAAAPTPPAALQRLTDTTARSAGGTLPGIRFIVTDGLGRLLADSQTPRAAIGSVWASPNRPEFASAFSVPGGRIDIRTRDSSTVGGGLLLVTVPIVHNRQAIGAVRASLPVAVTQDRVHRTWLAYALIGAAVVAVGLGLAWVLATSLARPVRRLEQAAVRLGSGDLEARAEPGGPLEVAVLARSFNDMAGAVSSSIASQREFVANASHQLRTPLTGLKLRLEAIEAEGGAAAVQAGRAQVEADRLNELVDGLLRLARATSEHPAGSMVDLRTVARDAVDRWAGPAEQAGKRLALDPLPDGAVVVWANGTDLGHVVDNLVENAIRYTPAGTEVVVGAATRDGSARLVVRDDGRGVPPEERDRVFDRFFRGSTGRRAGAGTGLGLAIVAQLVRRWGGEVRLGEGPGMCVEATFPKPAVS